MIIRETTFDKIKLMWKSIDWKDKTLGLYIDSPFCPSACQFCVFNPTITKKESNIYNDYYKNYLPFEIEEHLEIIKSSPINSIYFGGGTASYMTPEIMENIFSLIPDFKEIKTKCFEAHPAYLSETQIDILGMNHFLYVTLGVQTFNKDSLKKEKRASLSKSKLAKKIQKLKCHDIFVNCDLIAYLDSDLETYKQDFADLAELGPDVITTFPLRQRVNCFDIEKIVKDARALRSFLSTIKDYRPISNRVLSLNEDDILECPTMNCTMTRLSVDDMESIGRYNCSDFPNHLPDQNVLGIGGHGERSVFSHIGRDFFYRTFNRDGKSKHFYLKEK